jgi:heme exporter protein D
LFGPTEKLSSVPYVFVAVAISVISSSTPSTYTVTLSKIGKNPHSHFACQAAVTCTSLIVVVPKTVTQSTTALASVALYSAVTC